jgi:hypothetical protein
MNWISIRDILPNEDQLVVCYSENHHYIPLVCKFENGKFINYSDFLYGGDEEPNVTHWITIPEPLEK